MKVVVTGGHGQLGRSLVRRAGGAGQDLVAVGRDLLDVADPAAVAAQLDRLAPAAVINAAAYTAVDRAEHDRGAAFAVNAVGAGHLARACAARGIALLHVSTDHVFDGRATRPYLEDDAVAPLGVYGASKAAGEVAVLAAGGTVVRTSWLFAEGGRGFVPAIVRAALAGERLRVVADRHGCPTWSDDLAEALLSLAARPAPAGVYHYAGDGATTWHGLAVAIVEELQAHHGLAPTAVEPIPSAAWGSIAPRPAYAVLDTARIRALGVVPGGWRRAIGRVVTRATAAAGPRRDHSSEP